MNNLTVTGKQNFMGKDIPVVLGGFGEDKKCISDKTIAEIHEQPVSEIRRRITDSIKRFKKNIDFIDMKQRMGESHTLDFLLNLGYAKQSITQAEHIYILSERGYAKLIKIMDTDLAWEVHDRLIDEYFQMREEKKQGILTDDAQRIELEAKRMRAEAMRLNAQTRAFREIKGSVPKDQLSGVAFKVFEIKGLENVSGQNLGEYLPTVEKTYSAGEVGNRFGITSNMVGRLANKYNLKTDEYGVTVMDKSQYCNKEVPNFRYNEKGVEKLRAILKEEACATSHRRERK